MDRDEDILTDDAWAAGFFDGEGSVFSLLNCGRRHTWITIGQINPEVLERFLKCVGVGSISGPFPKKNPNAHPIYIYQARPLADVLVIKDKLWPWLGSVKRRQFEAALAKDQREIPQPPRLFEAVS